MIHRYDTYTFECIHGIQKRLLPSLYSGVWAAKLSDQLWHNSDKYSKTGSTVVLKQGSHSLMSWVGLYDGKTLKGVINNKDAQTSPWHIFISLITENKSLRHLFNLDESLQKKPYVFVPWCFKKKKNALFDFSCVQETSIHT